MPEEIKGKIIVGCGKDNKAFLIDSEKYGEIWIPKSQVEWFKNYNIRIWISDWMAFQKNLISKEEYESRKEIKYSEESISKQENLPF